MKAAYVTREAFDRLERSHRELSAHVVALTAVVGGIATAGAVDYERLEQCVNFAASKVRLGARPVLLAKAAVLLADFEKMQRALQVESSQEAGSEETDPEDQALRRARSQRRKDARFRESGCRDEVPPKSRMVISGLERTLSIRTRFQVHWHIYRPRCTMGDYGSANV